MKKYILPALVSIAILTIIYTIYNNNTIFQPQNRYPQTIEFRDSINMVGDERTYIIAAFEYGIDSGSPNWAVGMARNILNQYSFNAYKIMMKIPDYENQPWLANQIPAFNNEYSIEALKIMLNGHNKPINEFEVECCRRIDSRLKLGYLKILVSGEYTRSQLETLAEFNENSL